MPLAAAKKDSLLELLTDDLTGAMLDPLIGDDDEQDREQVVDEDDDDNGTHAPI